MKNKAGSRWWRDVQGDECPCDPELIVEIKNAEGEVEAGRAGNWNWARDMPPDGLITGWRVYGLSLAARMAAAHAA